MADHRIVMIESPARLSVDLGRIRIETKSSGVTHVLPDDIDVICLHHPNTILTASVLRELSEAGAIFISTDNQHQPVGILHPLNLNSRSSLRLQQQINFESRDVAPELWRQVVRSRVRSQAANLRFFKQRGALYLERLSKKVEPGDVRNHEGQGARHYWKHFFGEDYRRIKRGADDLVNCRLNFGYAVLRSLIMRQLVIFGLTPGLGIGHRSSENPFNLADDFIEPYRFSVERQVKTIISSGDLTPLDAQGKKEILNFIEKTIAMSTGDFRLSSAVEYTIESFCRVLEGRSVKLDLPVHQTHVN